MPSCRFGRGIFDHAAALIEEVGRSNKEITGHSGEVHLRGKEGCLEVKISPVRSGHKNCHAEARTFGPPEEALVLYKCLIEKLPVETQMNLFDYLRSVLEMPLKERARR